MPAPTHRPHPDSEGEVCEAFDEARHDELLSVEESREYLRALLGDDEAGER